MHAMITQTLGKLNNNVICNRLVQQISDFISFINTIKLNKQNVLVIFDVDDVLIKPCNDDDFRHPYRAKLWKDIKDQSTLQKVELLHSSILAATKPSLTDPYIKQIFNFLKLHHIPAIALTAMGTGNFGIIEKMEELRIEELNKVGISFASLAPLSKELFIPELRGTNVVFSGCTGIPMLKNGIIFTAGIDKGTVLEYLFNKYNYYPETIIFVDDYLNNLKSVMQLSIKLNQKFYGFHYTAISLTKFHKIDEKLEKLRFNILDQENRWLSYKQLKLKP